MRIPAPGTTTAIHAVERARAAQPGWLTGGATARSAALTAIVQAVEAAAEELSVLAVREVGKPLAEARAEAARTAAIWRYYAQTPFEPSGAVHETAGGPVLLLTRRRPRPAARGPGRVPAPATEWTRRALVRARSRPSPSSAMHVCQARALNAMGTASPAAWATGAGTSACRAPSGLQPAARDDGGSDHQGIAGQLADRADVTGVPSGCGRRRRTAVDRHCRRGGRSTSSTCRGCPVGGPGRRWSRHPPCRRRPAWRVTRRRRLRRARSTPTCSSQGSRQQDQEPPDDHAAPGGAGGPLKSPECVVATPRGPHPGHRLRVVTHRLTTDRTHRHRRVRPGPEGTRPQRRWQRRVVRRTRQTGGTSG
ncbi:aldehyde dehydrogenase family protein [Streptomyces griseochromogenes]|uniref:aldehyde dehydrogenase family protein n=1 Tax=Streptomyces griseochromogenes TaxID=68214 RepID=UPI003AABF76C